MSDKIRHLRAMEAFDRVARHSSVSKAAESLNVTQGAVSRQIKQLEASLGTLLFERGPKGVQLTIAGEQLYASTHPAFTALRNGVLQLKRRQDQRSLKVSLPNAVALKWLVPELPDFKERHPDIRLFLHTDDQVADFEAFDLDVALRFGTTVGVELHSEKIADEQLIAVASPLLIGEARRPMSAETIIGYPLLHDAYHDGWTDWAKRAGISPDRIGEKNIQYFDSGVLLQAAIDGQGIALARPLLAEGDIQAGRLVRLDDICVALDKALYFVCRPGDNDRPAVAAFRQWLMSKR
ncbi:DNA-binding transcriptional activator GcvA [Salinisphaera shabanensis T35B1]|uniref:LysR substrate-binding domain-containing protein n=1 Tax=Salinisphaera shabanensis TaxID=180542 RepID=UPI00334288BC